MENLTIYYSYHHRNDYGSAGRVVSKMGGVGGEDKPGAPGRDVVCAWCGVVMRRGDVRQTKGMCPDCYRRMLDGYTRPLQRRGATKVSQR